MTQHTHTHTHALYRFYGDTGQLLYVGITQDPGKRLAQHTATKHWWSAVRGISLDWYSSRADAVAAEKRAIAVERPLMNVQRPSVKPPIEPRCNHCTACADGEGLRCDMLPPIEDEEYYHSACIKCGKINCLFAIGYSHGEQHGWSAAWDYEKRRRADG